MSRKMILSIVCTLLLLASLAAMAAITTSGTPLHQVTAERYQTGDERYFQITAPLPAGVPAAQLFSASVEQGDLYLVTVAVTAAEKQQPSGNAAAGTAAAPAGTVSIIGRYGKEGDARLRLVAASPKGTVELMRLAFTLSGDAVTTDESVRKEWARRQQALLRSSDPRGRDSFTQYWNLAIAQRYGLQPVVLDRAAGSRREPPDLYSVFSGAAAIQETLQLELLGTDRRAGGRAGAATSGTDGPELSPATLSGPAVKSHPFKEMLKGRTPKLPRLAAVIPQDQYAVFFSDINRQIELADLMDEWGGNLLRQLEVSARDFKVREKVSKQLCLENSWLTRMFGDRVVAEMAFTGNDPFLKEGTAFTVLFSLKDTERFRKQLDKRFSEAVSRSGATRSSYRLQGREIDTVVSTDRSISSHAVIIGDIAAVSTSREALDRLLQVTAGTAAPLSKALDFQYMRTIFPQDAQEEDIFIYLSDAHIRNLVGPRWKIGEARRMRCNAAMGTIANARLWFKAERRREPTMAELVSEGYLGKHAPVCPDHGAYGIDAQGDVHCTLHNRPGKLTPVGEIPLVTVTAQEAAQYRGFVENYNRYWTQFFDPIGIRVKLGQDIKIQTCILPMIENSWYDGLAAFSGRNPGVVTEAALLPRTVVSLRGFMSPDWMKKHGLLHEFAGKKGMNLDWLSNELSINLCDGQVLLSADDRVTGMLGQQFGRSSSLEPLIIGYLASAINLPTYLTIKVSDRTKAEQSIPQLYRSLAPGRGGDDGLSVETYTLEQHKGKPLYVTSFRFFFMKLRVYTAVVDDRLVIASRKDVLTDLMDAAAAGKSRQPKQQTGNLELAVYRSAFKQLADHTAIGYQEELRHACHTNLPLASIIAVNLGLPIDKYALGTFSLRGYEPYCPSGGVYLADASGRQIRCSIHGTQAAPRQPATGDQSAATLRLVNSLDRVSARLTFTPEGLMTTVDIRSKPAGK